MSRHFEDRKSVRLSMNTKTLLLVGVACVALLGCSKAPISDVVPSKVSRDQPSQVLGDGDGGLPSATSLSDRHLSRGWMSIQMKAYDVLGVENPELLALSEEEAAWLEDHAYPTPEELTLLGTFDEDELLNRLRDQRDIKAGVLLGLQLSERGELDRAGAVLNSAASSGALYAMELHALTSLKIMEELGGGVATDADISIFVAQLEMARMLGDHNVDFLIDRYAPGFDRERHSAHILTLVAEFMRQRGYDAQLRGIPSQGPDPRPNGFEWNELRQKSDGHEVLVYDRRRS